LATAIGAALCDPSAIGKRAGAPQEMPGIWGSRVMRAMGEDLTPDSWRRCGAWPPDAIDASLGGDLVKLKLALDKYNSKSR
jgi:hypothetical protein